MCHAGSSEFRKEALMSKSKTGNPTRPAVRKAKGLTVLGIHTSETPGEKVVAQIQKKSKENRLEFPIAVDNATKNWHAWATHWWPSTYLIDKKGNVRYHWTGELQWDGQDGFGHHAQILDEMSDAVGDDPRFAAACTGQNEHRSGSRFNGCTLLRVELIEKGQMWNSSAVR